MFQSDIKSERFIELMNDYSPIFWPPLPNRKNHLQAGVLIPIIDDGSWRCIMTLRSSQLNQHSGEICFPGGKPDRTDQNLQETATREAQEELGIENPRVLRRLSSILSR